MLKISKPLGAAKVTDYYKFDYTPADQRYYAEGQRQLVGEWHGCLARKWGLVGAVNELHYRRMTEGQHPHTAEQLINHRPANDSPAWVHDNKAWRDHLEQLFVDAIVDGRNCFRTTAPAENQKKRNGQTRAPAERLAEYPVTERTAKLLEMHRIAAQTFEGNLGSKMGAAAGVYLE